MLGILLSVNVSLSHLPLLLCTHHVWICAGPEEPIARSLHVSHRHRVRWCLGRDNPGKGTHELVL